MANDKRMNVVILGLLSHEPLTGYEIKKRIDSSLSFFWSGSFGSIYPTLSAMEKDGLVKKAVDETGRGKITYSITENGKMSLKQWLMEPVKKDELRYETLLKLFFGNQLGKEGALMHIQNFEKKTQESLALLQMYEENLNALPPDSDHKYYLLTIKFGIHTYKSYLEWCQEARKLLE